MSISGIIIILSLTIVFINLMTIAYYQHKFRKHLKRMRDNDFPNE